MVAGQSNNAVVLQLLVFTSGVRKAAGSLTACGWHAQAACLHAHELVMSHDEHALKEQVEKRQRPFSGAGTHDSDCSLAAKTLAPPTSCGHESTHDE